MLNTKNHLGSNNGFNASNGLTVAGAGTAPVNTVAPVISGTAKEGQTLTTTDGTWTGTAPITYTYQWKRGFASILGATNNTYTLVNGDVGQNITCVVTATNAFGSDTATSNILVPILNPLAITNLQLYLAKDNATVSSWLDQSANAFDFVQGNATQQPVISANSVDFDSNDDIQTVVTADPLNSGNGYFFFSGYYDNFINNHIINSCDALTDSEYFIIRVNAATDQIRVQVVSATNSFANVFTSTNTITNGAYYYGYIKYNDSGNPYVLSLNGSIETIIMTNGIDNGKGLSFVANRDNLSVGGGIKLTPFYGAAKINKVINSNASLSAEEITAIDNFMSVPTNY